MGTAPDVVEEFGVWVAFRATQSPNFANPVPEQMQAVS